MSAERWRPVVGYEGLYEVSDLGNVKRLSRQITSYNGIVECAVTGVPDPLRGFVVKATVVLTEAYRHMAGPDLAKEIQTFVKSTTAPYKYPRIVEFVDELPKTISGKIRRVELRKS